MSQQQAINNNKFAIELCEVGDCESCLFSYCCSCCAFAQARTYLDESPAILNFCMVSSVVERWLVRSAYDIPGDACSDCYTTTFCHCCAANQAYQTAKARGNPVDNGGRYSNVNPFVTPLPPRTATWQDYAYSCCCMPCATGDMMERAVGMPWYLGCCCVKICAARNIMRYQYRVKGNDVLEEFAAPLGAQILANIIHQCFPCAGCVLWGGYAAVTTQLTLESRARPASSGPYLTGSFAPTSANHVAPIAVYHPDHQGVQMGSVVTGPPPAIAVYTHQQPIQQSIMSSYGHNNRGGQYAPISIAEQTKDSF